MLKINSLLSVFYPENCKCCQGYLVKGEFLFCLNCELNFGKLSQIDDKSLEIEQLFWGKASVESAVAVFQFLKQENLQFIVHEFKYKGNGDLAIRMGEIIGYNYALPIKFLDAVSYVPMHPKKEKKRGYNQAQKLAEGFSNVTGVKTIPLLERIKNTETQTEKDVFERFENMEDKFEVINSLEEIKHVLLIDDVITTGATLAACTNILTKKGVRVSLVSLAYRGLNF